MKVWRVVLALLLFLFALIALDVSFKYRDLLVALLAGASGVLLLLDR